MEGGIWIFDELTPRRQQKPNDLFDIEKSDKSDFCQPKIGFLGLTGILPKNIQKSLKFGWCCITQTLTGALRKWNLV